MNHKYVNYLLGFAGGWGLILLGHPVFEKFILFGGRTGFIVTDIIQLLSSAGFYVVLFFSILLIIYGLKAVFRRGMK